MVQNQSTFTAEELDANNLNKSKLIEFIKSGDAILMVGAGCSGSLFPAWGKFVDALETAAKDHDSDFEGDKNDFLSFADKVKACLGDDRYYGIIYNTFKPADPTHHKFHEALCRLPFKAITTTNYDKILEYALNVVITNPNNSLHFEGSTKVKIHEFLLSLNYNKSSQRRIAHLHGVYDVNESIVLGGKEYSSKYGFTITSKEDTLFDQIHKGDITKEEFQELLIQYGYEWPLRRKLLWALLATRRIFFVGFSMSDPYFKQMLEFVKEDLSTYGAETHFLLLRTTSSSFIRDKASAKYLKAEYGIETIFFFDEEGKYTGLGNFIADLDDAINIPETKVSKIADPIAVSPKTGDPAITSKLFELSKQQQSDED